MNEQILTPTAANIGAAALCVVVLLIATIMAISGFYTIKPGEAAAVRVFGAARAEPETNEGIHWNWPSPIGKTDVFQVRKNRTVEIGFQTLPDDQIDILTGEGWQRDIDSATMITGDLNLVEAQLVAHYYITDLNKYLFAADDPGVTFEYLDDNSKIQSYQSHPVDRPDGQTIKDSLETALRRAMGQRTIDQALITDRETIEQETMEVAQEILTLNETGIQLTSVQLQEVKAPDTVQDAFDDVLRAREEKETRINEALAFESKTLPEARGEAEKLIQSANAYRAERIAAATAEADRFLNILHEYQADPNIIASRMYLETIDKILPRINPIVITTDNPPTIILDSGRGTNRIIPAPTSN